MKKIVFRTLGFSALLGWTLLCSTAMAAPKPVDLNTPRDFPVIKTKQDWETRAAEIRRQILVSCGLWPLPARDKINVRIYDRTERDGYALEKVWLETYPGFFLSGNLYTPLQGNAPYPAVLNPHGHWKDGRLADNPEGSVRARCITFARNGVVAFSYDMAGYNDSCFPDAPNGHRSFATNPICQLWNINLMGLQTWNSIRALDFLQSLAFVDKARIACTGESGGGTQTFILGAVDDRLAAQAPAVMVSHMMQGGCLCENAPGLRVEYSNMEIAAAAAPRPQILVAATGDWTRDTLKIEGPAIHSVYQLFNLGDRFAYVRFDYGHNYNLTSRAAVYEHFAKWLAPANWLLELNETNYTKLPDSELRLFPETQAHHGALTQQSFIDSLKKIAMAQWADLKPRNEAGFSKFTETVLPAWEHTLLLKPEQVVQLPDRSADAAKSSEHDLAAMRVTTWFPANDNPRTPVAIICEEDNRMDNAGQARLANLLVAQGLRVVLVREFKSSEPDDQFKNFYTTYNRTRLQNRVRALIGLCNAAKNWGGAARKVVLIGQGHTGPWALLASPVANATAADCMRLDSTDEQAWLDPNIFCPGILKIGGLEGAAVLACPRPLLLHNTGDKFAADTLQKAFEIANAAGKLRVKHELATDAALVSWAVESAFSK
jgi:hypothetical protein